VPSPNGPPPFFLLQPRTIAIKRLPQNTPVPFPKLVSLRGLPNVAYATAPPPRTRPCRRPTAVLARSCACRAAYLAVRAWAGSSPAASRAASARRTGHWPRRMPPRRACRRRGHPLARPQRRPGCATGPPAAGSFPGGYVPMAPHSNASSVPSPIAHAE
jgi:hypothetical protein